MTITQQRTTAIPDVDEAFALYAAIFSEINTLAAQRHLMTVDEFSAVYRDPHVLKFYVHDDTGDLAGIAVLTQDLDAWPLISPQYFARRWPEHYSRRAIWYVGFVGVLPGRAHGFRELVANMYTHIISNNGIAVMDCCTYNVTRRRLPAATLKLLGWLNPHADVETADTQSFFVYRFDQAGA